MGQGPALLEDGRLNPGYLKLDLFCQGLRLAPDCRTSDGRPILRVRAGLGSGLELRIPGPGGIHVNVPTVEPFAKNSPYELRGPLPNGRHMLAYDGKEIAEVFLPPCPRFYARLTASGKPMVSVGILQGTYLGVYYGGMCANWKDVARDNCRFCSVGDNLLGGDDTTGKSPADVAETALAARDELGVTFVHVNGGFDDSGRYLDRFGPVLKAVRERTGMLTGFQVPPLGDFQEYHALKRLGVNNVSLCYEIWNPKRFEEVCPGKARRAGLQKYLDAIQFCAQEVKFDTTNGEMIAGLEDPADSMAALDWLTSVGAVPTVCVFRPVVGTDYENLPPPKTEELVPVFAHYYTRCMERGLPIGIAPNVHVSIVLNPEECRWLLPPERRDGWKMQRLKLAALRKGFNAYFRTRLKLKDGAPKESPLTVS